VVTSSTDAIAASTTPGAVRADGAMDPNRSTISPAKTAGMSSTPTASNQSKNTRERRSSTIGSRLRTPIVTSTRPWSCVDV
jgi:hypothetical protein